MSNENDTCVIDGCGKRVNAHGLCNACYRGAKRLVDSGEESWESLITMGLARSSGRASRWGVFSQAHAKAKEGGTTQ